MVSATYTFRLGKCQKVASTVCRMLGSEVENRPTRETGVESTELDPTVLMELGSIETAVYSY